MCIDEEFKLQGNFNSAAARLLMLTFEVCRESPDAPERKCQDYETVIKPWLSRKFLFTLENKKLFQKEVVDTDEKVSKFSQLTWNVLSPQLRQDIFHKLSVTELQLEDKIGTVGFEQQKI
mmetsp:Transcript_25518/g.30029  ORF Transcript_25518/g.30029 Transcript_25518/m.30029 type:complete len:120 (+) Transcript_25518:52-411(+)